MTKIAGALNMLPKTTILQDITNPSTNVLDSLLAGAKYPRIPSRGGRGSSTNPSTNEAIEIYKMDRNYPRFYRNFLIESNNGRPSLRLANTFSLLVGF
jgi:hypothetical protein